MKKTLCLLMLFAFLLSGISFAYTLKEESKLDIKDFQQLLGDKLVSFDTFSVSLRFGNLFFLARDNKTRNLEWYLINPFAKKILKNGICPFKAFERSAVSPDDSAALVFSRYPSGLWKLDLEKKEWKMIYDNPGKDTGGLAILPISPLFFMESYRAFSIFDEWDKEHFVINTFIVSLAFDPFAINKLVSLKELHESSIKAALGKNFEKWECKTDFFRFGEEMNMLYVLKTRSKDRKKYIDYLLHFAPPANVTLLEKVEGRITPLDYRTRPMKALYTAALNESTGKPEVIFKTDKGKSTVLKAKVITGRIMDNDLLGVAAINVNKFQIFLGTAESELKLIKEFSEPYRTGFINDGRKLVLMNKTEVRCFRINK